MRLSTKGRYAVMAVADLARQGDRAVSLAEIASRQQISLSYLEQLFARLRRAGLVRSVRGPGGGYRLARSPAETHVADVVLAVDEPIRATRCTGASSLKGCMPGGERCLTHELWEDLGRQIHRYLAAVSIEDILERRTRRDVDGGAATHAVA
jgi:Rrf2 family iron-sulfur cluster assembly transcriptional regulator